MEPHRGPILLVEDDPTWQTILTSLCEGAGHVVVAAYDASAALHHSRRLSPPPVLALVDLELLSSAPQHPAYDGLQVLTAFRDQGIYTVVVSGNIPHAQESLVGRPEVYDLVDKYHFSKAGFGNNVFLATVHRAVAHAEADLRAEGQLPEQQAYLRSLSLPSNPAA